ncbi:exonuclease [Salmonella enterica]|nr:exonuclease [Salmonella enterica subsp. enterica serovar Give]EDE7121737.1 exonuclease [Salmonella enterica subsp. enterica serovar Hvittingfoss]EDH3337235.1 exonuclease [Salmonella enterica]ECM1026247.1 exonuclease [Salmonella enterica subsp. enterica serovar Give]EDY1891003.1 exonuclease [Salmonella enterica]
MSDNKTEYSYYIKVKNESARKRLGFPFAFWWKTESSEAAATARLAVSMLDAGFEPTDFAKPVRVNFPVVNELPPEGSFDTTFWQKYELGGEDGKTLTLIPGAPATDAHDEKAEECADDAGAKESGTDTSDNDECQDCEVSVATLPFPQRVLHIFTYAVADKKYLHHATRAQRRHITVLEMEQENSYIQNLLMVLRKSEQVEKLDNATLFRLTEAIKTVFSVTQNHQPWEFENFVTAWLNAEHPDRGLLVKEWQKGNRVSRITRTASGANAGGGNLTDRGEGFIHDQTSLARDVATGVLARSMDVDIYDLHPAHAKRVDEIVAENKPPFSVFRDKFIAMPGRQDYSRAIVVASVKEAPIGIEAIPARVTEYLNRVLTETDHANPDPLIVDIACGRTSQPMPVKGSANDDEEKPQPSGAMADEPATPETMEPDTTEHHQDAQPLDAQSQVDAAYQKILTELHEARKNIPPKNPVDFGEQLAVARGEYVEGISDPNDPKWVHNDYSASNQDETADDKEQEKACNTCGQAGGGSCPDCGAVMDDATYQETFNEENLDESQEKDPEEMERAEHPHKENAGSDQHNDSNNETDEDELNWKRQVVIAAVYGLCANPAGIASAPLIPGIAMMIANKLENLGVTDDERMPDF